LRAGWRFYCGRRPRRLLRGCTWRPNYPFPMINRLGPRTLTIGVQWTARQQIPRFWRE
jgi:hypothetical protein